ncbi:MAG: hypothetical protein VYE40_11255 [Myxococcota bacterium]|nr:hypothetical protein [Myxococcota bacterium]
MSHTSLSSLHARRACARLFVLSSLCALTVFACDATEPDEVVPVANTPEVAASSLEEEATAKEGAEATEEAMPGAGREVAFPSKKEAAPRGKRRAPTWQWALDKSGREGITQREAFGVLPGSETRVRCMFLGELNSDHVSVTCDAVALAKTSPKPEDYSAMWAKQLDGQFVDQAALVIDREHLYMVHHSMISSGATAMAFDIRSGKQLWKVNLEGLGPVSHSKYRNEVQVRIERGLGGEHLVVFGRESSGRYIERRDLSSGALASNDVVESRYPEIPELLASMPLLDKKSGKLRAYGTHGGSDISYTLTEDARGKAILTKHATDDSVVWSKRVPGYAFDEISSFREHGNRVFMLIPGKENAAVQSLSAEDGALLGSAYISSDDLGKEGAWLWQRRDNNLVLHHGVPTSNVRELTPGARIEMSERFPHETFEFGLENELVAHIRVMNEEEHQAVLMAPGARWGAARVKVTNTLTLTNK